MPHKPAFSPVATNSNARSVSITGTASISAPATALTLGTGEVGIITWNEIIPGATMVWTPIDPY